MKQLTRRRNSIGARKSKSSSRKRSMADKYIVAVDRWSCDEPSSIVGYSNMKQAKEDYAFQKNCAFDNEMVYLAKIIKSTKGD